MKNILVRQRNKLIILLIILLALLITFTTADPSTSVVFDDAVTPTATIDSASLPVKLTTSSPVDTYSLINLDDSIVAWWRGENNLNDESGNTLTETWHGTEAYDGTNARFGSGFSFGASSDYIQVADDSTLKQSTMSFSAWIYGNNISGGDKWFFEKAPHDGNYKMFFTGGKLRFFGGNNVSYVESTTSFSDATLYHIVGTINGTSAKLYVNGSLEASGSVAAIASGSGDLYIGVSPAGASWDLSGVVDEFIIFSRELTSDEVLSLYNSQTTEYNETFTVSTSTSHTIKGYAVDTDGDIASTSERTITYSSATVPTVTTSPASSVEKRTAVLNATVTSDGNASTTDRGFYYGTSVSYGSVASTTASGGIGTFSEAISGLTCNTTYHFMAFAINSAGTATSSDATFETDNCGARTVVSSNTSPTSTTDTTPVDTNTSTTTSEVATTTIIVATSTEPVATTTEEVATTTLIVDEDEIVEPEPEPEIELETNLEQNDLLKQDEEPEVDIFMLDNGSEGDGGIPTGDNGGGGTGEILDNSNESQTESGAGATFVDSLVDVTKESVEKILSISREASDKVDEIVNTPTGSLVTKTVATAGVVTGSVLAVSSVAFANPITFTELWLLPARLFGLLAGALGVRRKNRPWGTVYDSITKRPLDPAYVTLYEAVSGKQIASAITDLDGRYGFLVPPGVYKIVAQKTNYNFPSSKISGITFDEVYNEIYNGGEIMVGAGDIITKNIPMDPQNFDWNEFAKEKNELNVFLKKKDITWAKVSKNLFLVGFLIALIAVYFAPAPYNYIIVGLYALTIISNYFSTKKDKTGLLSDRNTGMPLSFAIIKIFREGESVEMMKKVADKYGEYYALLPKGRYYVKIDKKNDDGSYTNIYQSDIINAERGVINTDLQV